MGSIYKRKFKDKNGNTKEGISFWIRYQNNGKPVYESAKSTKWADAARLLKLREGEIAAGKAPGNRYDKVMFKELIHALKEDYKLKGQRRPRTKHLEKFFEGVRAIDVTTTEIKRYINYRLEGRINRELAAL